MSGQNLTQSDTLETEDLYKLTQRQEKALDSILSGRTDQEAAESAGVRRQTVNSWKLHHPAFRAEMNRRRAEAYDQEVGRLRTLRESALQVVETALQNGSLRAALAVLRLITPPSAPTVDAVDPHKLVENEAASKALNDVLMPSISGPGDVKARERELRARLLEKL